MERGIRGITAMFEELNSYCDKESMGSLMMEFLV